METLSFANYAPEHRETLQEIAQSRLWQALLSDADAVADLRSRVRPAPAAPSQLSGAAALLIEKNRKRAQTLVDAGITDIGLIQGTLANWTTALDDGEPTPLLFLGLVLTLQCCFSPRCAYCNQEGMQERMRLDDWKAVLKEAAVPVPPYVYFTGGEPVLLGEELWGDDGLIAFAAGLGCATNLNSNAALITPNVAVQLVLQGLSKIHISIDSCDPCTQGELFGGRERVDRVWRGLYNLQIARELLGAEHPEIHVNCVVTCRNLLDVPELLQRLTEVRAVPKGGSSAEKAADLGRRDFAFHLIPVGGVGNASLRPSARQWRQFYTEIWAELGAVWREYQERVGIDTEHIRSLESFAPFSSPYHRVSHAASLEKYCERASRGDYWQTAFSDRCYLAPTQAYVLPDGSQHWCGGRAIRRPNPVGNVLEDSLRQNIRNALHCLRQFPDADCVGCAGATCVINQSLRDTLRRQAENMVHEAASIE